MKNWFKLMMIAGAVALVLEAAPALGQAPVIASFGRKGELVCTNLQPGTVASVGWAAAVTGPWTNSWAGLATATADSNGAIRVSVPMFYRVRGTPPPTNPPAPAGMVLIPAGPFTMGDNLDGVTSALPLHTNQISAFYMDKYEVTKALWDEVRVWANTHGYTFDNAGSGKATNHPVHTVSWYDVVKWCNARSEKESRVSAYYTSAAQTTVYRTGQTNVQNDWVKWSSGYRLPTESEWEKAARGGASGQRFPWGNTITWSRANYYAYPASAGGHAYDLNPTIGYNPAFNDGVYPYTSPVGYFAPNGYGLYAMAGNLWEWTWDWWGSYTASPATDPHGPVSGSSRMMRGGSWYTYAIDCRAANRYNLYPTYRDTALGFRSVLSPGQP